MNDLNTKKQLCQVKVGDAILFKDKRIRVWSVNKQKGTIELTTGHTVKMDYVVCCDPHDTRVEYRITSDGKLDSIEKNEHEDYNEPPVRLSQGQVQVQDEITGQWINCNRTVQR